MTVFKRFWFIVLLFVIFRLQESQIRWLIPYFLYLLKLKTTSKININQNFKLCHLTPENRVLKLMAYITFKIDNIYVSAKQKNFLVIDLFYKDYNARESRAERSTTLKMCLKNTKGLILRNSKISINTLQCNNQKN